MHPGCIQRDDVMHNTGICVNYSLKSLFIIVEVLRICQHTFQEISFVVFQNILVLLIHPLTILENVFQLHHQVRTTSVQTAIIHFAIYPNSIGIGN